MKDFKFFQRSGTIVTPTPTNVNPHLYGLTIRNHPDAMFGDGEVNVVFYWLSDDVIRGEYEIVMYQGSIGGFANAYEIRRRNPGVPNGYLPNIPRLHSIEYENGDVYDKWNHEFQSPNQMVTIFYKLYTR